MKEDMPRDLAKVLEDYSFGAIQIERTDEEMVALAPTILSTITGVRRTSEDTRSLLNGDYCVTNDNLLKMVAIFVRVRCGIPVVLMGECGCGKSELMKFLCAFLRVRLLTLNVHGGTKEEDVLAIFEEARVLSAVSQVWVFLDEVNTCNEIGLLSEVIVSRQLHGKDIAANVQVIGAVNPYRKKTDVVLDAGLGFNQHVLGSEAQRDEMKDLVYRVHSLPATLLSYVFDFGFLEQDVEAMYIKVMVRRQFPQIPAVGVDLLASVMHTCQNFVRATENEPSSVSLRDVKRCLLLMDWFGTRGDSRNGRLGLTAETVSQSRFLSHSQFAEARMLEYPCEEEYAQYTFERLQPGLEVALIEDHDQLGVGASEIGVCRQVDISGNGSAGWGEFVFRGSSDQPIELLLQFHKIKIVESDTSGNVAPSESSNIDFRSTALALAHVYYYRLSTDAFRRAALEAIAHTAREEETRAVVDAVDPVERGDGGPTVDPMFANFTRAQNFVDVLEREQALYCDNMVLDKGIAKNKALRENVFVVVVSLLNKIPVFVVGKPGTSKSLTMRLIADNLRGQQSPNPLWRNFPAVHVVPYQCSPHSTSDSILFQFQKACDYASSRSEDTITVLLLDEVGLAELSPDLPLKVLHEILVNPPIAIVGISNWVLDPAKMNRACLLRRPDLGRSELAMTASQIAGGLEDPAWLESLSTAFHTVYTHQRGRAWIGMRDFYSLIKALRSSHTARDPGSTMQWAEFMKYLCRNFGGKPDVLQHVLRVFSENLTSSQLGSRPTHMQLPSSLELVRSNLQDTDARHLMVLTDHGAALTLLFQCSVVAHETSVVLIGSCFSDDMSEYHLISQINAVKRAMHKGQTVILLNCDNLYEALYDVLNQAFVTRVIDGHAEKFLRLAVGKRSQLCPVHERFRMIAVAEQEHAYNSLDLPLLNRLEKQLLRHSDVADERGKTALVEGLAEWVATCLHECGTGLQNASTFFPGFHDSTIGSLVLAVTEQCDGDDRVQEQCQLNMVSCATPLAVLKSKTLRQVNKQHFEDVQTGEVLHAQMYSSLGEFLRHRITALTKAAYPIGGWDTSFSLVMTRSPSGHLDEALAQSEAGEAEAADMLSRTASKLQLADFDSESAFATQVESFFFAETVEPTLLVVQCDPFLTPSNLIDHARYICVRSSKLRRNRKLLECSAQFRERLWQDDVARHPFYREALEAGRMPMFARHVLFVLNVPIGIIGRARMFSLTFDSTWSRVFIDDLRQEDTNLSTAVVLRTSAFEISKTSDEFSIERFIQRHYTSGLALILHPQPPSEPEFDDCLFPSRIAMFKSLLGDPHFAACLQNDVESVLKTQCEDTFADGLQGHVHIAMSQSASVGSLRQALTNALEKVITMSLATAVARMDRNHNLRLLHKGNEEAVLWNSLSFIRRFGFSHADMESGEVEIQSDGIHGFFSSKFPFSYHVINYLAATREEVDSSSSTAISTIFDMANDLDTRMKAGIGVEAHTAIMAYFGSGAESAHPRHYAYLHDFINLQSPNFAGLPVQSMVELYEAVLRCCNALSSPALIHAATWFNEERLFHVASILNELQLHRRDLFLALQDEIVSVSLQEDKPADIMTVLDRRVLSCVINQLGKEASDGAFGARASGDGNLVKDTHIASWIALIIQLRSHVVSLITLLVGTDTTPDATVTEISLNWTRVEMYCLLAEEVIMPSFGAMQRTRQAGASMFQYSQRQEQGPDYTMSTIIVKMQSLLRTIHKKLPFEVDVVFLLAAKLYEAVGALLSNEGIAYRATMVRRYLQRFFVELLCTQKTATWSQKLVQAIADIALGTSARLPRGVLSPPLQRSLLHAMLSSRTTESMFNRCLIDPVSASNMDSRIMFTQFCEDCWQWQKYVNTQAECSICFEVKGSEDIATSKCRHVVCADCSEDLAGECPICRTTNPKWLGLKTIACLPDIVGSGMLDDLGENTVLDRLRAIALTRYHVRSHAQKILAALEAQLNSPASEDAAEIEMNDFFMQTQCEGARLLLLRTIWRQGGAGVLDAMVEQSRRQRFLPWFIPKVETVEDVVQLPFDPFVTAKNPVQHEEYTRMCLKIGTCVLDGSFREADLKLLQTKRPEQVMATLFTAAYAPLSSIEPTQPFDETHPLMKNARKCIDRAYSPFLSQPFLLGLCADFTWLPPRCTLARSLFHARSHNSSSARLSSLIKMQVVTQLVALAEARTVSWFAALLREPISQATSTMPSMPEDEISMILRASERDESERYGELNTRNGGVNGTVWYTCERGHPYSVGDCGRNIVVAKCMCGAKIGGREHTTLSNNAELDVNDHLLSKAGVGYMQAAVRDKLSDSVQRPVRRVTVRLLRLMMHGLLAVGALDAFNGDGHVCEQITSLVFERTSDPCDTMEFLVEQFLSDWKSLREQLEISDEDVALLVHVVVQHLLSSRVTVPPTCKDQDTRLRVEQEVERLCVSPVVTKLSERLASARASYQQQTEADKRIRRMVMIFGEETWANIQGNLPTYEGLMWAHRESLTLQSFQRAVAMVGSNTSRTALVLGEFLSVEAELALIKHLPAVLAWHRVLFEALGTGISREEAGKLANRDVIKRLPATQQRRAEGTLERFCLAFNDVWPSIDFLFGCQQNHFRDLVMQDDTPSVFSLPNQTKGEDGLQGSCTIAVIDKLQTLHNTMLLAFRRAEAAATATATATAAGTGGGTRHASTAAAAAAADDAAESIASAEAPIVNYLTDEEVLKHQLVVYDRASLLFPILLAHSNDDGRGRNFDMERIADDVSQIFRGKSPISVHTRHFIFTGELQKIGLLAKLAVVIPQNDLTSDLKARLAAEIDTSQRCAATQLFLEKCIRFISSLGRSHADQDSTLGGETTVGAFAQTVLHIDPALWNTLRTPVLEDSVCLCNLQSTYLFLEECLNGSPLEKILPGYRQELPPSAVSALQVVMQRMDLTVLIPAFRHFLDRLVDGAQLSPSLDIKNTLGYESTDADHVLLDLDWFETYFPEAPLLKHALAAFKLLSGE